MADPTRCRACDGDLPDCRCASLRTAGASTERERIIIEVTARRDRAARHRHAPYGDGCDDCGREKALDDLLDWLGEQVAPTIPRAHHIPHSTAALPAEDR